jgi:hypothetical protein
LKVIENTQMIDLNKIFQTNTLKNPILICGALVLTIILVSALSFNPVEAKPIKHSETIRGLDLSCSTNRMDLSCVAQSASGGTVGQVSLVKNFGDGGGVCDLNESVKKRISVSTRNTDNCSKLFNATNTFDVQVLEINNGPGLTVNVSFNGTHIFFI